MRHLALVLCLAACSSDPASTSPDASTIDATPDASPSDVVTVTDASAEAATPDVSAPEAAVDVALEAATDVASAVDVPSDVGRDVPAADAGTDVTAVDVPQDARVNCDERFYRCARHEDCQALCVARTDGHDWCCLMNGTCGTTSSFSCLR